MHFMNRVRRLALQAIGAAALTWRIPAFAAWNADAFNAKTVEGALAALGITDITDSSDIVLKVDDIATDGAVVPVGVTSNIAGTDLIAVIIDKNPQPLALVLNLTESARPQFSARFKMAENSAVRVVVRAKGKYFQTAKQVGVTVGGCGDGPVSEAKVTNPKLRATRQGDAINLRMLFGHPMESGQRHDEQGKLIPAYFIQEMTLSADGQTAIDAQLGRSVSRNPVFAFRLSGIRTVDLFSVKWHDNRNESREAHGSLE